MSSAPWQSDSSRERRSSQWRLGTGEDVDRALWAAEHLLARAIERRRHEQNRRFGLLSGIGATTLTMFFLILSFVDFVQFSSNSVRVVVATISILAGSAIIGSMLWGLMAQRRRLYRDDAGLMAAELASIINSVLFDVADREEWSYFRLETTKLRLAAFPLPEEVESPRFWNRHQG